MANVLLTEECVRSCPYCFAKKHMADSPDRKILKWDDLLYIADFLDQPPERRISLLGGEPTLHPDFVDFIIYLQERHFNISVFTSGIMSQSKLNLLKKHVDVKHPSSSLSFVVNLNHPDISSDKEHERISAFLESFGEISTLSFNIYTLDFTMEYLFEYIKKYNLRRHIRLGLAHPIPWENNTYINLEDFGLMAERLSSYLPMFEEHEVSAGFDCGFPLCKFSDESLGRFFKLEKGPDSKSLKFVCNAAIDIGPDMTVWSCFPLSRFKKKSLYEFNSLHEIAQYYSNFHKSIRDQSYGLYNECRTCTYIKGEKCHGGCLAHILKGYSDDRLEELR